MKEVKIIDPSEVEILLDSGAFSMHTKGIQITLDEYASFVKKNKHVFRGGQIALDVLEDKEQSYRNWQILRDKGADTIPVFHLQQSQDEEDTSFSYLDKYLKETDYIAIGAVARLHSSQRMLAFSGLWDYLRAIGADKSHKFHILGVTAIELVSKFPWYSADSATTVKQSSFGNIFVPQFLDNGKEDYTKGRAFAVSDQRHHRPNEPGSFLGLPPGGKVQQQIIEYCHRMGGELLSSIEGRRLRTRTHFNKKERLEPKYNLGLFPEGDAFKEENLCTSYKAREFHNHGFFNKLAEQIQAKGNPFKLYTVISNPTQIETYFSRMDFDNGKKRFLVSYFSIRNQKSFTKMFQLS